MEDGVGKEGVVVLGGVGNDSSDRLFKVINLLMGGQDGMTVLRRVSWWIWGCSEVWRR